MSDTINYGNLMHNAMRHLIQQVLSDVARDGLPGQHHFFITFDTRHSEVDIAGWLSERYPEEMTIVIQHWFDNLDVTDAGFAITLNFGDQPEPLYVPYDAIKTFVDPSVEFGLRFEQNDDETQPEATDEAPMADLTLESAGSGSGDSHAESQDADRDAEVVSLDSFRK